MTTRIEAQARADAIRVFEQELGRLEHEGVLTLTAEQRHAIGDHHAKLLQQYAEQFDIDRSQQARQLSWGMRIASFLGALAFAASIFFLFYRFWGLFPTAWQVGTLVLASAASFGVTVLVQRRDPTGYFTKLAAMVAFACFVLNISLLGQIFDITPSDKALLPWAAYAFLLAYACDLRLLLAAGILCLDAFIAARTGTWGGMYWLDFGERPENFLPAALLLFLVPRALSHGRFNGFAQVYRVFALLSLFLPMLVLANYGDASYLDWDGKYVEWLYQVLGFAGSAAAAWLGVRRHWPEVANTGTVFFVIFLYTKFFDWWWDWMPKYLFFLVIALTALLFLFVMRRLRAAADGGPLAGRGA